VSIGETLAEARRQAGLTITQVSQQTRIRETIIRSIEQGDFSPCAGDFYARGHIRAIASVVGVDPVPLIREYDAEHGPPGSMSAADVFEPATPIRIREPRRSFGLGKVMIVVLLAVIGVAAYHLASTGGSQSKATPAVTLHSATPKPKPKPTVSPVAHKPPTEAVIRLTAVRDCWVALTTASGHQLYQGTIRAGESKTWLEKHPVSMVIGNPSGIVLTVNGKTETPNTVQVATLSINPGSKTPVTTG
jgi:cytoskeletal protein RodZ